MHWPKTYEPAGGRVRWQAPLAGRSNAAEAQRYSGRVLEEVTTHISDARAKADESGKLPFASRLANVADAETMVSLSF